MLVLIVGYGFFKDKNVSITTKTLVLNSTPSQVYSILSKPEECRKWSSLFKSDKEIEFKFESNKIHWRLKETDSWSILSISKTTFPTELRYQISINGDQHNTMDWKLIPAGKDTELECTFKLELPWYFSFFKESFEVKMNESLEKNILGFKTYFETRPTSIEAV